MASERDDASTSVATASDTLHDIHFGKSFLGGGMEEALISFRYTQKPLSLDSSGSAVIWGDPSTSLSTSAPSTSNLFASFPSTSASPPLGSNSAGKSGTAEIRFTGQAQPAKDVECVLVWDEELQSFSLERLDSSIRLAVDRTLPPHPHPTPDPNKPYIVPPATKARQIRADRVSSSSSSSDEAGSSRLISLSAKAKNSLLSGNSSSAPSGRSRTVSAHATLQRSSNASASTSKNQPSRLAEVEDFGSGSLSDYSPGKSSNRPPTSKSDARVTQSSPIKPSSSNGLHSSPQASPKLDPIMTAPPLMEIAPQVAGPSASAIASKRPAPNQRGSKAPAAPSKRPVAASKSVPSRAAVDSNSSNDDDSSDEDDSDDDDDEDEEDDDPSIPEGYLATPGSILSGQLNPGQRMLQQNRVSNIQAIASGAMTRVGSAPNLGAGGNATNGPPKGVGGVGKGKGAARKSTPQPGNPAAVIQGGARAGKSTPSGQRAQKGPAKPRTLAADTPDSASEED